GRDYITICSKREYSGIQVTCPVSHINCLVSSAGGTITVREYAGGCLVLDADGVGCVTLEYNTLPIATAGNAGLMSPEDKEKLERLPAQVEDAPSLALRRLFVAAGAEYNDTGANKTKTAPWGETVTHKAGHYYLNGLGDITEEQMMEIYTYTFPLTNSADWNSALRRQKSDDNMVRTNLFRKDFYASGNIQNLMGAFMMSLIEVVCLSGKNDVNNLAAINLKKNNYLNAFSNCYNLKHIIARLDLSQQGNDTQYIGYNNPKLITCYLSNLCGNLRVFDTSVNISKESILFCVRLAKTTSAITITLHPDAYARLADDADIVAALEAQPLVSLVSA
ncbi:MAG: hypothetical protein IKU66_07620, partial [Clostridia bacterium]|nr:hypothetical protein [Clostridia bacterium]